MRKPSQMERLNSRNWKQRSLGGCKSSAHHSHSIQCVNRSQHDNISLVNRLIWKGNSSKKFVRSFAEFTNQVHSEQTLYETAKYRWQDLDRANLAVYRIGRLFWQLQQIQANKKLCNRNLRKRGTTTVMANDKSESRATNAPQSELAGEAQILQCNRCKTDRFMCIAKMRAKSKIRGVNSMVTSSIGWVFMTTSRPPCMITTK